MGLDLPVIVNLKRILAGVDTAGNDMLTLGLQQLLLIQGDQNILKRLLNKQGGDVTTREVFEFLGFGDVKALDISDYEGAEILHDLNLPVPAELQNKFSCVLDGGTLEHVFDFPSALNNAKMLVKPGGHFIGISPMNNSCGHGFYQLSPELIYRTFSPEYGFEVEDFYLYENAPGYPTWRVRDPKILRRRIEFSNVFPVNCVFIARKIDSNSNTAPPQQSDYVDSWDKKESNEFRFMKGRGQIPKGKVLLRRWSLEHRMLGGIAYKARLMAQCVRWLLKGTTLSASGDFERVSDDLL